MNAGKALFAQLMDFLPWAARRLKTKRVDGGALRRAAPARIVAHLMTIGRGGLSRSETVTVAAIGGGVPQLVEAREITAAFQAIIRKKTPSPIPGAGWSAPDQA